MKTYRKLLALLAFVACREPEPRTSADSQAAHVAAVVAAGGVVDSIHAIAEHLARFRASLPPVDSLRHASTSRDSLAVRFVRAIAERDSVTLNSIVIDRAEFAWLFYPHSHLSRPPYEAPPELLWGQILATSNGGAQAMLRRYGGHPLRFRALHCPDSSTVEGPNRLHENCRLTFDTGGATPIEGRFFGTILERDGRFKFVGLGNSL